MSINLNHFLEELNTIPGAIAYHPGERISDIETLRPKPISSSNIIFDETEWAVTDEELWEEIKKRKRNQIDQRGIDALAWYRSFHDDPNYWGIFIPLSSLAIFDNLALLDINKSLEERLETAWNVILHHEQAHFAIDFACAQLELMFRAPIRREFTNRFLNDPPFSNFTMQESYLEIEEAVANAYMLQKIKRSPFKSSLKDIEIFTKTQPSGYRDGLKLNSKSKLNIAVSKTLQSYSSLWGIAKEIDLNSSFLELWRLAPLGDKKILSICPIYALNDLSDAGLSPASIKLVQCIPEIIETPNFEKKLRKLSKSIQDDWYKSKNQISVRLPNPPRFEKLRGWKPPTWSLRLHGGFRVHLERPDSKSSSWAATSIGSHKEMGHG